LDRFAIGVRQLTQQPVRAQRPLFDVDVFFQDRDVVVVEQPAAGEPDHRLTICLPLTVLSSLSAAPVTRSGQAPPSRLLVALGQIPDPRARRGSVPPARPAGGVAALRQPA
jgi:hypothetical protein